MLVCGRIKHKKRAALNYGLSGHVGMCVCLSFILLLLFFTVVFILLRTICVCVSFT
jgi:hypothetical protein